MTIIVNRKGEFVASSKDDKHLPISAKYLERVLEFARPNKVYYIDPELSQRDVRTLQTTVGTAKKRAGVHAVTFRTERNGREFLGLVKVEIEDHNVIV